MPTQGYPLTASIAFSTCSMCHVHRLAPIPQEILTPVAQAEEEVVAEAALEEEIVAIVDVAVR